MSLSNTIFVLLILRPFGYGMTTSDKPVQETVLPDCVPSSPDTVSMAPMTLDMRRQLRSIDTNIQCGTFALLSSCANQVSRRSVCLCLCVWACVSAHACLYVCVNVRLAIYVCECVWMCLYMCVCVCVCVCRQLCLITICMNYLPIQPYLSAMIQLFPFV